MEEKTKLGPERRRVPIYARCVSMTSVMSQSSYSKNKSGNVPINFKCRLPTSSPSHQINFFPLLFGECCMNKDLD